MAEGMATGKLDMALNRTGVGTRLIVFVEADATCRVFWSDMCLLPEEIVDEASGTRALGGCVEVDAGRVLGWRRHSRRRRCR